MLYLRVMIKGPTTYLKTNTSTLTRTALRLIAMETMKYCMNNMGINPTKPIPTVSIVNRGRSRRYGQYNTMRNKIEIHYNVCGDVKMVIKTIIHEYSHYLQNMKKYYKLYKLVGYDNHPYEIEAIRNETIYSPCWKHIKNKL